MLRPTQLDIKTAKEAETEARMRAVVREEVSEHGHREDSILVDGVEVGVRGMCLGHDAEGGQ